MLDFIPKVGSNIIYEIKDSKDNIRVIAKDVSRQRQRRILVTYKDNHDAEHEILVCDGKLLDANFYLPLHIRRKNLLFIKLLLGWESYYERLCNCRLEYSS